MAHRLNLRSPFSAAALALLAALVTATALPVRAQNFTLGDVIDSLRRGDSLVSFATRGPIAHRKLDSLATVLADANARSIGIKTLAAVITSTHVRYADAVRWDPRAATLLGQPWFRSAVLMLANIANGSLADTLQKVQPSLLGPTDALGTQVRADAMAKGAERLRRMGIKYGEGAPSLNIVEATANYLFQWIPGLKSGTDGSPSRYEFLAAYRTAELTPVSAYPEPTPPPPFDLSSGPGLHFEAANQIGLRWYHWRPGWGQGSMLAQALRPRYASAGFYLQDIAGNQPLDFPGRFDRPGVFIGWGSVHVAYSRNRLLVGTDKQIIPRLF